MHVVGGLNSRFWFLAFAVTKRIKEPLAGVSEMLKQIRCHQVREGYEGLGERQGGDGAA